ncbi:hypothetical protein SADUNF_Sadunf01G0181500 [Salix dunnii]|uniref:Large ribosomal subunit protein bL12 C-terminal domain-containing protein n=1 Tax=Salix dunnii TaxID=1413687 RepID=A0A835TP68_9ROSI|nr:hypothetical protein SADUNF_Sadunf01G0181500 [Salix dunnii]
MGLGRYGPAVSGAILSGPAAPGSASGDLKTATAAEKTAFDIKLEKFDAAAKIKVIKEVRTFTDLGLKEAKDLVEKVPVVLKKGLTKEEAGPIIEKLKALGATVQSMHYHVNAWPFMEPVDACDVLDYYDNIKDPMVVLILKNHWGPLEV